MELKNELKKIIDNYNVIDESIPFAIATFSKDGSLVNLELAENYSEIFFNNSNSFITTVTDLDGNILLSSSNIKDGHVQLYFSDKDIVAKIIDFSSIDRVSHYRYDEDAKKLISLKEFFNYTAGEIYREVFDNQLLVLTDCENSKSSIYSLKDTKIISPFVDNISTVYNDDGSITFLLEDNIKVNNLSTTLTMLVDSSGRTNDTIYDSYFGEEIKLNDEQPLIDYQKVKSEATKRLHNTSLISKEKEENDIARLINTFYKKNKSLSKVKKK